MRVEVLGPLCVDGDDVRTSPRDRVVLEALAADSSRPLSIDQLADALWADDPPASSVKVVQGCVSRLRRRLGNGAIETTTDGYRLTLPPDEVDATRFVQLVERGRELVAVGQPARATHVLQQAVTLWRGRPFGDLDDWEPARIERRRLEELRFEAEELTVEAGLLAGDHAAVLAIARALAEREPFRERRWVLLARAEYQVGRQADSLRTLSRARTILRDEAGLDPTEEIVELEAAILRHDPVLDVAPSAATAGTCPYPGLVPFGVDDSELFFGREDVVANCLRVVELQNALAVVGPSGSGKSSMVRAGVAAALRRAGRTVRIVTPGPSGMAALADHPLDACDVLVVDQMEESVRFADGNAFLDLVAELADRTTTIIAVRADHLGDVSAHSGVARLVERGLVLLPAMSNEELRRAIAQPARAVGLLLEEGLVDVLVREVEDEPGVLPMLAHALRETWERREGRVLTVAGYGSSGGLRGAVAQTAENLYRGLDEPQRAVVRDLMLRMLTAMPEGEAVRSPVPRRLVAGDDERDQLVEQLVDARLVTSDDGTVELAHEALVRAWPRLRTWLDDDVEGQRILRHLTLAADGWAGMGRPDSELYRGTRLANALAWRDRSSPTLTTVEVDFLEASRRVADEEHERLAERARVQARQNRRLRAALAAAAVLLVAALVAGVTAVRSAERASSEAASAERAAASSLVGLSRQVADQDRGLALLLAVEAQRAAPSNQTRAALVNGLFDAPFRRTSVLTPADDHYGVAIDAEGTVAVAKRPDGGLDVLDLVNRQVRHQALPGAPSLIGGVAVDPDGRFAASGGEAEIPTVVYDLATGDEVVSLPTDGSYELVAFSPDGRALAILDGGGSITLHDVGSWQEVLTIAVGQPLSAFAFDASGERVFVATIPEEGSPDSGATPGTAGLLGFDAATGERVVGPVETTEALISSIAAWPGHNELAVAGWRVQRFSTDDLAPIAEPFGTVEVDLVTLAISRDGLLFAGSPVELQAFDLATAGSAGAADEPERVASFEFGAPGVAVTADGRGLVTADIDGDVSTWTLVPDGGVGTVVDPDLAGEVTASPDRSLLAVWDTGPVTLVDARSLDELVDLALDRDAKVMGVDIDGAGERVVTLSCPREPDRCVAVLDVWDVGTGRRVAGPTSVGEVWPGLTRGVAFARQDASVVVPLQEGVVGFWGAAELDPEAGRPRLADETAIPGESAWGIDAVDVDGRSLVVAQDELGQSVSWDVTSGQAEVVGALENAFRMQYLADGRLVTASGPGPLTLRDPVTLEPLTGVLPATIPADTYAVSDDGLLVASGDHGVQLFDLDEGTVLTDAIPAARSTISPDGSSLYLGAAEFGDAVRVVSLVDDELVTAACRQAGRNLSLDEWRRLVGTDRTYRPTCTEWPSGDPTAG